jgi:hypothetical protein
VTLEELFAGEYNFFYTKKLRVKTQLFRMDWVVGGKRQEKISSICQIPPGKVRFELSTGYPQDKIVYFGASGAYRTSQTGAKERVPVRISLCWHCL